jgi:hypothetical protein
MMPRQIVPDASGRSVRRAPDFCAAALGPKSERHGRLKNCVRAVFFVPKDDSVAAAAMHELS